MNSAQIEDNLQKLVKSIQPDTFVYDFLLAYGQPRASISRLQKGGLNLADTPGEVLWKKKLFFKAVPTETVHASMEALKQEGKQLKSDPRFLVVTDFETLLATDRKTGDTLDIPILDLAKHYDFFLPWAGMEKAQLQTENPADVKAAERMAKLYDEIKKDNPTATPEAIHDLNVFLSRLLFCFFAEDTGIFEKGQFTSAISSHTQADGSDLGAYLDKLFDVLNTEPDQRRDLPAYLNAFPYVNGGLFRNPHRAPAFTRRSRQMLIESGELDWAAINPDIFGSMIQAVITPEHRGGLGMHYTSVPNIMKVIEPLFLNDLREAFDTAKGNLKKLQELRSRIARIKIFDPACGSGNFLIIAYKELRRLEMAMLKDLAALKGAAGTGSFAFENADLSLISLGRFYGIELDDFAHEVATLSLWLAEHQMNQEFFSTFGRTKPALPLTESGHIVHGNACRLDWETVCPKEKGDEVYVLGNPPYLGSSMQSTEQKEDMAFAFRGISGYKNLDYIACWFLKGASFIQHQNAQLAFVSTNSICQGEQVALLWPHIFAKQLEIGFAHTSFKWENSAKANAAVIVVIIGIRSIDTKTQKLLFVDDKQVLVKNINAYLSGGGNYFLYRRKNSISRLPLMLKGNQPTDGGNLILDLAQISELQTAYPNSVKFIKKLIGSDEFINGHQRWCLWITDDRLQEALEIPFIKKRIENVATVRSQSKAPSTRNYSGGNHRFIQIQHEPEYAIVIPEVSSERRIYIPIGFCDSDTVLTNKLFAIYNSESYILSILTSMMHMIWVKTTCGRLKTDYSYSSALCYNTFPFPSITDAQKQELEKHVFRILEAREKHSEKTLAQLYDPDKMPEELREAHRQNDLAVERCYRSKPFESDEERLEYLFKLYEKMIAEEKGKGTLFGGKGSKGK